MTSTQAGPATASHETSHGTLAQPDDTTPHRLRIDAGGDSFPVSSATPTLTWTPGRGDDATTGYVIEATVDDTNLEARRVTAAQLSLEWPWEPLASGAQVRWRVARAEGGASSDWHDFECGLLDEDWRAAWIAAPAGADVRRGHLPAHIFSTSFDVPATVVRARLYATALGVYDAAINGRRVGTTELAPGTTSYDRTLHAQAYDVTSLIGPDENSLSITLSAGWYLGQVGAFRLPAHWGDTPGIRAELHLELTDGSTRVIASDGTWTVHPSRIIAADLMDGQITDLLAPCGPATHAVASIDDAPPISWSPAPPVRVIETRSAVRHWSVGPGAWVLDFGQNASGWVSVTDLGPRGTRTDIDYGEFASAGGDLDLSHLDSHRPGEPAVAFAQHDVVISDGTSAVFEPRHTVHGFQYVRVTRTEGSFDPSTVAMRIVHTDLEPTGSFECSNEDVNRLHAIADWSFRGNAVDVPTDCPTRERLAWTGDYQVFAPTATRLYDVSGFTRKWLQSVRDDQLPDGRIANFSPDGRRIKLHLDDQFAMMTGSAGWGDAVVLVPWEMYLSYGDAAVLAESWDAMVRWVEWARENARTARHHSRQQRSAEPLPHEQFLWDGSFHWGEWTEPVPRKADGTRANPIQDNPMEWFMADKGEVGTAYLYLSTATLAKAAEVLGKRAQAAGYAAAAEQILDAWRTEFLAGDGRTATDTQASYARALSFGLIPADQEGAAAARLAELVHEAGNHLTTGFLATGRLLPALADAGYADVAYGLLFQRTEPSWLTMVDRGATTVWEDWDGIDRDGTPHESLNHYSKGAVARFLHTHTLGLRQADGSAGWASFVVAPHPDRRVTWARGHHDTPRGRISVDWRLDGDRLQVEIDSPASCEGTLVLPDGRSVDVEPGRFTFGATLV